MQSGKYQHSSAAVDYGLSIKQGTRNWRMGSGERGTGNGERGIFKMGNL